MLILNAGGLQIRPSGNSIENLKQKLFVLLQQGSRVLYIEVWNHGRMSWSYNRILLLPARAEIGLKIQDENDYKIYVLFICYVEHNKLFFRFWL